METRGIVVPMVHFVEWLTILPKVLKKVNPKKMGEKINK
jgi:hypothetical protein